MSDDYITAEEWRGWMSWHGLDPKRTQVVEIVPESFREQGKVLLRVQQFAADSGGHWPVPDPRPLYRDQVATEIVWIPLQRLPSAPLPSIRDIADLCDWTNPSIKTPGSHADFHYGGLCPYQEVVPAFLLGKPDPRRPQA